MRKEIIQTGATVEEAIDSACLLLGKTTEDCEFEIIDLPKKSFFGLRKIPAKVKVWTEVPEEKSEKTVVTPKKDTPKVPDKKTPKVEKKEEPISSAVQPTEEAPLEKKTVVEAKEEKQETSVREITPLDEEKIAIAKDYVAQITRGMGIEGEVSASYENGTAAIMIHGKSLGAMIGRRGETLNAIQYLTSLVANRLEGDYLRITVDAGDYRLKRDKALEEMAIKAAEEVLRTNISCTLESMNPAERRIVHSAISTIEGVSSSSVGTEPHRCVMIKTPTSKIKGDYKGKRNRGGRNNGKDKRPVHPKKSTKPVNESQAPNEPLVTQETQADTPLYGKIELD